MFSTLSFKLTFCQYDERVKYYNAVDLPFVSMMSVLNITMQ